MQVLQNAQRLFAGYGLFQIQGNCFWCQLRGAND